MIFSPQRCVCALVIFALTCAVVQAQTLTLAVSPSFPAPYDRYEEMPNPSATKFDAIKNKRQHIMVRTETATPTRREAWQAFVAHLSEKSGIAIELQAFESRLAFELATNSGRYDLVYLDPMQFVTFKEHPGYNALVKRAAQPEFGIVVVQHSHSANTIEDLSGQTLGVAGQLDFSGSIAPRESLRRRAIDVRHHYFESGNAVMQAVIDGTVAAGAAREADLKSLPLGDQQKLRLLWTTPSFTPFALAVHPRVSFFTINRLQRALVTMDKTSEGRDILQHIFVENGFETASNSDWHDVALIDIETLNQPAGESRDNTAKP